MRIYMDANATTPVLPEVVEAMRPFWSERFGNASSIHQPGQGARAAVDRARESVARMLGCRASEIVFTSGGTESDNLALFGVLQPLVAAGQRPHLITTAIEHHAILHAAGALAGRGVELSVVLPNTSGVVEPGKIAAALRPNTRLVSVMLANNETGAIQPVAEMAALAHAAGAQFHTDAIQAVAKLPIDLAGALKDVDLLSISGHKMYAPQGTGALFVRSKTTLTPLFFGGSHERARRAGTENVPGIVGLGRAAEMALSSEGTAALGALRDRLEEGVLRQVPDAGVNGGDAPRVPNTTNLFFVGVDAEALVIALDLKGLAISGGSACQSGATEASHVLSAMGLVERRIEGSVRVSLSRWNTVDEVDRAVRLIVETVTHLRAVGR